MFHDHIVTLLLHYFLFDPYGQIGNSIDSLQSANRWADTQTDGRYHKGAVHKSCYAEGGRGVWPSVTIGFFSYLSQSEFSSKVLFGGGGVVRVLFMDDPKYYLFHKRGR